MKNRLYLTFASMFYIGFIPGAPGTYASLATTVLFFLVYRLSNRILPPLHLSAICLINDSDVGEIQSGEFRTIRIARVLEHDLLGKIVR